VVWSQILHLRASSVPVPTQYKDQFDQAIHGLSKADGSAGDVAEHWKHATEFETIVSKIRQVDGYERFLLPQLYPSLRTCASCGIVVLIIPSDTATDVIVITSLDPTPRHLQVPALNLSRLQGLTAGLKRMSNRSRDLSDDEQRKIKIVGVAEQAPKKEFGEGYGELLGELWTELVHPIINSLDIEVSG
jgi:hypothetical protein